MPPFLQRLQQATKMVSRRKVLLLVLGCGTLSLLIHQGAQLSWAVEKKQESDSKSEKTSRVYL
ncbi:Galactose-3-O-sulfotransferase 3 [Myotis davidii]|uniref:Galactose-3-O-sulfotransferase 3 n=1 Tax=Myotis davidii TaxID=225400 RepID=L5LD88_MYODS|nr:Galactose-3-O-sulfotransferase 3 [Myotis davidii]